MQIPIYNTINPHICHRYLDLPLTKGQNNLIHESGSAKEKSYVLYKMYIRHIMSMTKETNYYNFF